MGVFHHWWVGSYDDWAAGGGSSELSGRKAVAYAGTTVEVSEDWPVHDVTAEPHTCIRIPVSGMPATRWTSAIAAYADMAWYAHWPGPRRIKQYRGGHTETCGGRCRTSTGTW